MTAKTAAELKVEVQQLQADLYAAQVEETRAMVVETDEPDWLSSAGKYMVAMNRDGNNVEVAVYRHNSQQAGGSFEKRDIPGLILWLSKQVAS